MTFLAKLLKGARALARAVAIFAIIPLVASCAQESTAPGTEGTEVPKPAFNDQDELLRPDEGYREWVYVGTPLTPNELNPPEAPFPEFHNVYIHPGDFEHYKDTGEFPDGTILVKELVTVGSKAATSGNGYFMG